MYFLKMKNNCRNFFLNHQLKNINTSTDAVIFLKYLDHIGYDSPDKIMDKIYNLFLLYLPTEKYLEKLSLIQQSVEGLNNIEDYSLLTIWTCAILAIIDNEEYQKYEKEIMFLRLT